MQLVAYGAQDVYLSSNPQITFFKIVYRRYTNFATQIVEHPLTGTPNFNERSSAIITRSGDLLSRMYLKVVLDTVATTADNIGRSKFAWVRRVGHSIIRNISVEVGGTIMDTHLGEWMDIWFELSRPHVDNLRGYLIMIGDVPELTTYNDEDKPEYTLFIPLQFWFCRNTGLAIPLIALQYHETIINVEFRSASEVIIGNDRFIQNDIDFVRIKDASLLTNYIYLDTDERRRFSQVGHEYLIEQVQFNGDEFVRSITPKYTLDFNHPTKEIFWCFRHGYYFNARKFLAYTDNNNWTDTALEATKLYLGQSITTVDPLLINGFTFIPGDNAPYTVTGTNWTITSVDTDIWVVPGTLTSDNNVGIGVRRTIQATVTAGAADILIDSGSLTVRDISIPTDCCEDNRFTTNAIFEVDDIHINQWNNCGLLIDGTVNPVRFALLQLNGHDRFDRRTGEYFNYVQPEIHHTNTVQDGINVYSFSLFPEKHQPSGTANLTRIDSTELFLWLHDPTFTPNDIDINFINEDSRMLIFGLSYNIFRIMSGLGGLAYK